VKNLKTNEIFLPDIVGKGYGTYWNYKGRYRVCKGSRASKKSTTTAMNLIYRIMEYPESNALVVRKTYRTLLDSCFAQLKWAVNRLGVKDYFDFKLSPLEIIYKPTGQKILFRGLDDPLKVTSVTVDVGSLCFLWIEEAYEIMSEADFDMLDESIRGEVPKGHFKQITLTFNPWNERHWIKRRFFDKVDKDVLAITTNYTCNEWLDRSDLNVFERMKENNPRRYQVAGLGNWGIVDGLIYENFEERQFTLEEIKDYKTVAGLDFGYTNDPTAFFIGFLDKKDSILYVWDEMYSKGLSNKKIYENIKNMGYSKEKITGDSAEPKSIDELKGYGLRIKGAKKGKDSILNGIQWIQDLKIVIHPRCNNFLTEISNYQWDKDKFGKALNRPIDDFNHLLDAMRYALEDDIQSKTIKAVNRSILGL
jgi:phage terminase large subunit